MKFGFSFVFQLLHLIVTVLIYCNILSQDNVPHRENFSLMEKFDVNDFLIYDKFSFLLDSLL